MRDHEGNRAVEAERSLVYVFEHVEIEETVGFGVVFEPGASGRLESEAGSVFGYAVDEIGAVKRHVEADRLWTVRPRVGMTSKRLSPILIFVFLFLDLVFVLIVVLVLVMIVLFFFLIAFRFFVLQLLEIEQAMGVEGNYAFATGFVADVNLERFVAENGVVFLIQVNNGGRR